MKDKDKIYFNACLYAIDKLVEKGSRSYCFKTDDGWHSATWGDTMSWILEKLNEKSDKLKADDELLDKIRTDIINYESDCRLSVDEYPLCKKCNDKVFKTIYGILNKYKAESEQSDDEERSS